MSQYSIKELESLSGVKAHTIRIWEKRYNLLSPKRTDTNIRFYSDDDFKKLINVVTLTRAGFKISKLSKMDNESMKDAITETLIEKSPEVNSFEILTNELLSSSLTFDEHQFDRTFSSSVLRHGIPMTMENVVYPLLQRIGLMWGLGDLNPAQEHFASNLIRQKLFSAIDGIPHSNNKPIDYLLFLPDWEQHEIGLLYSYYLLKASGKSCVFLGARVPFENLVETMNTCKAQNLVTFITSAPPVQELQDYIDKFEAAFDSAEKVICGSSWFLDQLKFDTSAPISTLSDFKLYLDL